MIDCSFDFLMAVRGTIPKIAYGRDGVGVILLNLLLEWARYAQLDCYDEKYTPAFLGLTYGQVTDGPDVVNYIAEIERETTGHTGVLDVTARELISGLDDEQVRRLFGEFGTVNYAGIKDFYPLVVELMTVATLDNPSNMVGRPFVNELEKGLMEIAPEMSFYDGCSGSGVGAMIIAGHCNNVYLQDIVLRNVFYTTIACVFKGVPAQNISIGDSLLNMVEPEMKFDRIVMEPPAKVQYPKDYFAHIPKGNVAFPELEDGDTLYLRHALARLNDDGTAVVLVPAGSLYKSSAKVMEARKKLVPYIDSVIYLPGGIGYQGSAISSALIVLKKNKCSHEIYMVDASEYTTNERGHRYISREDHERFEKIYHDRAEVDNISVVVSEQQIIDAECNLTPSKYIKAVVTQEFNASELQKDIDRGKDLLEKLNEVEMQLAALRPAIDQLNDSKKEML